MKKTFLLLSLLLACTSVQAQKTARDYILEDPHRAANTMHRYEPLDLTETPAPEGYTPFYISHIGRHGSRYELKSDKYDRPIKSLTAFSEKGQLTKKGEELLNDLIVIRDASTDNYGKLTDLGRKEHREISQRMYERFTPVFCNPQRDRVIVCSTKSGRVLSSRKAFLERLNENAPSLKVETYADKEIFDGASAHDRVSGRGMTEEEKARVEELKKNKVKPAPNPYEVSLDDALERFFYIDRVSKPESAKKALGKALSAALSRQTLAEEEIPDPLMLFTADEIYTRWYSGNISLFNKWCISEENQGVYAISRGSLILKNWIDDADKAVAGNDIAASLRFSHDTCCQPFFALVGASGNDYMGSAANACDHFMGFASVCMGCNMQFIFYKNADGHVIVKILHNEKEVVIPSLEKINGVYHDWALLRPYLVSRLEMGKGI